jgi:feruloyl esterase
LTCPAFKASASASLIGVLACAALQAGGDSPATGDAAGTRDASTGRPFPCGIDSIRSAAPADTTITKAERNARPVPHCLVEGYVTTTDPGPNRNNFRLQLPDDFAGRYYFIGLGGSAGAVPSESQAPAGNPMVKGFAVAGTDTGHQGSYLDWSFVYDNRAKAIDHNDRGAHVTAVATQQITKAYYATTSLHRYHAGCSGGGRMGTMAGVLHPGDYDGLLIGSPAITTGSILMYMWNAQHLSKGPAHTLPTANLAMLEQTVMQACDESDGVLDDMIWDPRRCAFDVASLACTDGQDESRCFTAPQLESIRALLAGPSSPAGPIYPGLQLSNASHWPAWFPDPAMKIGDSFAKAYFGPNFDFMTQFDFNDQSHVDAWWKAAKEKGFGTRAPADYSEYERLGGKVLFWHGVSDPGVVFLDQLAYYEQIREELADDARFRDFATLYLVPGLLHCGGGTGPVDVPDRLLETLIDWVEKDRPPGPVLTQRGRDAKIFPGGAPSLVAPQPNLAPREFLLCPYPQMAAFEGKADSPEDLADGSKWECGEAR